MRINVARRASRLRPLRLLVPRLLLATTQHELIALLTLPSYVSILQLPSALLFSYFMLGTTGGKDKREKDREREDICIWTQAFTGMMIPLLYKIYTAGFGYGTGRVVLLCLREDWVDMETRSWE